MKTSLFLLLATLTSLTALRADESKIVFGPATAGWEKQIFPNGANQPDVSFATEADGVKITVEADGKSSYPGIRIQPESPWDVAAFGRMEAVVTNTSQKPMRLSLRVDDATGETATGSAVVKPGETASIPVYLDYSGKSKLKSSAIKSVLVFGTKAKDAQTFRVDRLVAAGAPGEKPPVDATKQAVHPPKGVMLGEGVTPDAKQLAPAGSAKGKIENGALRVDLTGAKDDGVTFKPVAGFWNLNEWFQVRVQVKNTGSSPATPSVRVESGGGPTAAVPVAAAIPPGGSAEIVVPFAAAVPWQGSNDPDVSNEPIKKNFSGQPDTGTKFTSHRVTGVTVLGDGTAGANLLVTKIAGENPALQPPEWLGQRPPVEGEWVKTFDENFDGTALDQTKWNIYGPNFWDKRTHFSKDNTIVKDGTLTLRVERKTGKHNDAPDGKETDYATGFADTYGKWVQRYGYFEARLKLPTAPCMWPAFWLMPDRGLAAGDQGRRQSTKFGGMEFDIVEQLSIYGPQRFNFAMHWDGYGGGHKATGSGSIYVPADKDGFITVGLLWLPGEAVLYTNGQEVARWKNDRVSSVPSNILLDHVTGGWEVETLDDKQLPADFVIDYIRVWQRKDLASAADGPKPNKGEPAAPKE